METKSSQFLHFFQSIIFFSFFGSSFLKHHTEKKENRDFEQTGADERNKKEVKAG